MCVCTCLLQPTASPPVFVHRRSRFNLNYTYFQQYTSELCVLQYTVSRAGPTHEEHMGTNQNSPTLASTAHRDRPVPRPAAWPARANFVLEPLWTDRTFQFRCSSRKFKNCEYTVVLYVENVSANSKGSPYPTTIRCSC